MDQPQKRTEGTGSSGLHQARGNFQNIPSEPQSPPYWSFTFWDLSDPEGLEADEPPSDGQSEGVHSDLTLRPDAYIIPLASLTT